MPGIILAPLEEAVKYHGAKTPVGSKLRTKDWQRAVPVQIREVAQASAAVESARYLQRIQDGIGDVLSIRRNAEGVLTDRSAMIRDLMRIAEDEGLRPPSDSGERGGITDVGSEARTALIYEMQTGSAYGYADWKAGQDEDALDAAPAQELIRAEDRNDKRDWHRRWVEAGGRLTDGTGLDGKPGRLIALKTDPVWTKISRFGRAFPPFDFGSGVWVEDVLRPEAEELGVIAADQRVQPQDKPFAENWETSVKDLSPELRQSLQKAFPDTVTIEGDSARWQPPKGEPTTEDTEDTEEAPKVDLDPTAEPKRFATWQDGKQWADQAIAPQEQGFRPNEVQALQWAQKNTKPLNDAIWKDKPMSPKMREWSRRLSATVQSGPELPNMELYHYTSSEWWGKYEIGKPVILKGFTSTTLAPNPKVKRKFEADTVVKFRVQAGKRAVYQDLIRDDPSYAYQAEVLFDKNTKIVVQSKLLVNGILHIVADIL